MSDYNGPCKVFDDGLVIPPIMCLTSTWHHSFILARPCRLRIGDVCIISHKRWMTFRGYRHSTHTTLPYFTFAFLGSARPLLLSPCGTFTPPLSVFIAACSKMVSCHMVNRDKVATAAALSSPVALAGLVCFTAVAPDGATADWSCAV